MQEKIGGNVRGLETGTKGEKNVADQGKGIDETETVIVTENATGTETEGEKTDLQIEIETGTGTTGTPKVIGTEAEAEKDMLPAEVIIVFNGAKTILTLFE